MKALKVQGIRGGEYSSYKKIGGLVLAPETNDYQSRARILIDNYSGCGDTYQERKESLINIVDFDGNTVFAGSMVELVEMLKRGKQNEK